MSVYRASVVIHCWSVASCGAAQLEQPLRHSLSLSLVRPLLSTSRTTSTLGHGLESPVRLLLPHLIAVLNLVQAAFSIGIFFLNSSTPFSADFILCSRAACGNSSSKSNGKPLRRSLNLKALFTFACFHTSPLESYRGALWAGIRQLFASASAVCHASPRCLPNNANLCGYFPVPF